VSGCPTNPAPPQGYTIWKGNVPAPLVQWAMALRDKIRNFPWWYTWSMDYNGQTVIARRDAHTWTWKNGILLNNICIPGITLYSQIQPATGAGAATTSASPDQVGLTPDQVQPDPAYAVYGAPETTDWPLTGAAAVAILAIGTAFALALRHAGQP
jgi:hypothetical protein